MDHIPPTAESVAAHFGDDIERFMKFVDWVHFMHGHDLQIIGDTLSTTQISDPYVHGVAHSLLRDWEEWSGHKVRSAKDEP